MAKWYRQRVLAGWHQEPISRFFRPGARAKRWLGRDSWWRTIVALILTMTAETAYVGQLHIQNIELKELIQRSAHIVIAVPDDPPLVEEQVAIKARGKKVPPYIRSVHRFRVRESLRGDLASGTAIAVAPAGDALQERLHRDYYTKVLNRHVVVDRYEQQAATGVGDARILFLNNHGARFAYTVEGGAEGLALRSEVELRLGENDRVALDLREALVDQALRAHGDFGVYGDLRAGLKSLRDTSVIQFTDVAHGVRVDIVPRDRHGHEYQFLVTPTGVIEGFMAGESDAAVGPVPNSSDFSRFMLRDVQGLYGGQNVYVAPDGTVHVQIVRAEESQPELQERRYRFVLKDTQRLELKQLLVQHPPSRIRIPHHPGIPDQARPEITVIYPDGTAVTVAKWDDDRHPDFDALYESVMDCIWQIPRVLSCRGPKINIFDTRV